jgi:hypothetical protein
MLKELPQKAREERPDEQKEAGIHEERDPIKICVDMI